MRPPGSIATYWNFVKFQLGQKCTLFQALKTHQSYQDHIHSQEVCHTYALSFKMFTAKHVASKAPNPLVSYLNDLLPRELGVSKKKHVIIRSTSIDPRSYLSFEGCSHTHLTASAIAKTLSRHIYSLSSVKESYESFPTWSESNFVFKSSILARHMRAAMAPSSTRGASASASSKLWIPTGETRLNHLIEVRNIWNTTLSVWLHVVVFQGNYINCICIHLYYM